MVQSLEEYVAQATNAYKPSQTAIQNQLGALDSQYATTESKINRNYEQQQSQLENQRNQAAEASSMSAAGSGGAFGGAGNLARRKYYEQTFVPAQTQLQTNKANELDQARQNIENQRTSLNSQLANLEAQANQQALQQYWSAVEAEKQREEQRRLAAQQAAAQNSYASRIMDAMAAAGQNQGGGGLKNWNFGNGYSVQQLENGQASYRYNGVPISAAQFLAGANQNLGLWNDIWNNGVKTQGVGSDTINVISRFSKTPGLVNNALNSNKLSYLKNIKY